MNLIGQITDDPVQSQTLVLQDGSSFTMTITYVPLQYGWFLTSLVYGAFTLQGTRITVSPNFLYQFKNQIPFGIACIPNQSNLNREPTQQQDFSSSAFSLYVLTQEEVNQYTQLLEGETPT